jgi:hypothetical protein
MRVDTAETAVEAFRDELATRMRLKPILYAERIALIRGRNLACWCGLSSPCHADVWLEVANK